MCAKVREIQLDRLLNNGMIRVTKRRDIYVARILPRDRMSPGSNDIIITSASGNRRTISRAELIKSFMYINGKKIRLAGWESSKAYMVYREVNNNAIAVKIPLKYRVRVNEIEVNSKGRGSGDYIVADLDANGDIIENTIGIIPSALFRKMYYMPRTEVNKMVQNIGNSRRVNTSIVKQKNIPNGQSENKVDTRKVNEIQQVHKPNTANRGLGTGRPEAGNKKEYVAVGRLMSANGELVGFVLQSMSGKVLRVNKAQAMQLCNQKLIANLVVAVRPDTNRPYIRGNNIRIESLSAYRV